MRLLYFDTAVQYGNGESEKNLGRVLRNLKATNVVVGTKVRLPSAEFGRIADAVATSLEGSLSRLSRDCVDIFHLHNAITDAGGVDTLSIQQVLDDIVPAFERLRQQGKTRFLGLGRGLTHSGFAGVHRSQRLRPGIRGPVRAPQALVQAIDERCCGSRVGTARGKGPFRESLGPARNGK